LRGLPHRDAHRRLLAGRGLPLMLRPVQPWLPPASPPLLRPHGDIMTDRSPADSAAAASPTNAAGATGTTASAAPRDSAPAAVATPAAPTPTDPRARSRQRR